MQLSNFNHGILFFVILTTSIIMMVRVIFYKKQPEKLVTEASFQETVDKI